MYHCFYMDEDGVIHAAPSLEELHQDPTIIKPEDFSNIDTVHDYCCGELGEAGFWSLVEHEPFKMTLKICSNIETAFAVALTPGSLCEVSPTTLTRHPYVTRSDTGFYGPDSNPIVTSVPVFG
jgi:hypothetical protein